MPTETSGYAADKELVRLSTDSRARVPRVILRPRKAQPFFARHPWVFASAIEQVDADCADGGVVDLTTDRGEFVARGILNRQSQLAVRLYTWNPHEALDSRFWSGRIERAIELRARRGLFTPHGATRLVHSEADGLSGLVIDWFAGYAVVQLNSLATASRWDELAPLVIERLQPRGVVLRCDKTIAQEEGMQPRLGIAHGTVPETAVFIEEHGLRYGVDLLAGQKTGFYLDQAENRLAAARWLSERRVLDMFCYTGAFTLAAARLGGAADVLGIDSSKKAVATAEAHAQLNEVRNVRFQVGEAFESLTELAAGGPGFGGVILDPPKFTRTRRGVEEALRAYHRLNRQAVDLIEPGGILVTCSCSGGVTREEFVSMLVGVAQKSRREIQLLEQRGASSDHPVSIACPETEYLKCLICRVL